MAESCQNVVFSLHQLEKLALDNNQRIRSRQHFLNQRNYEIDRLQADYYPQVSLNADAGLHKKTINSTYGLNLIQKIFDSKLKQAIQEAEISREISELEFVREINDVLLKVRQTYLQITLAKQKLNTYKFTLDCLNDKVNKVDHEVKIGNATDNDKNQILLLYLQNQLKYDQTQMNIQKYLLNLTELLNIPSDTHLYIEENVCMMTLPIGNVQYWESIAIQCNPEICLKLVDLCLQQVQYVNTGNYPTVEFFANAGHATGSEERFYPEAHWKCGINMSWPLYDGGKSSKKRNGIIEARKAIQCELNQLIAQIQGTIRIFLLEIETYQQSYFVSQEQERLAKENMDIVDKKQFVNMIPLQEYHEALKLWQDALTSVHQAKINVWDAYFRLVHFCGGNISLKS